MPKLPAVGIVAAVSALAVAFASQALAAGRSVTVGDDFFVRKGSPPTVPSRRTRG